jgi:hypothetical protein
LHPTSIGNAKPVTMIEHAPVMIAQSFRHR